MALEREKRPAYMVYLSDHGESPSSKGWRTATDRDLWDVPFVIWLSKKFRRQYPEVVAELENARNRPLQSDQLFFGLLRLAGVDGLNVDPTLDFAGSAFVPRSPRVIMGGRESYRW